MAPKLKLNSSVTDNEIRQGLDAIAAFKEAEVVIAASERGTQTIVVTMGSRDAANAALDAWVAVGP